MLIFANLCVFACAWMGLEWFVEFSVLECLLRFAGVGFFAVVSRYFRCFYGIFTVFPVFLRYFYGIYGIFTVFLRYLRYFRYFYGISGVYTVFSDFTVFLVYFRCLSGVFPVYFRFLSKFRLFTTSSCFSSSPETSNQLKLN